MSDPPSSLGGSHESFKWSACMSLACRFSGDSGASDRTYINAKYRQTAIRNLFRGRREGVFSPVPSVSFLRFLFHPFSSLFLPLSPTSKWPSDTANVFGEALLVPPARENTLGHKRILGVFRAQGTCLVAAKCICRSISVKQYVKKLKPNAWLFLNVLHVTV